MKIKKLHEKAILPHYATDGASAFDVFAYEDVEWVLGDEFWEAVIPTGWRLKSRTSMGYLSLVGLVTGLNTTLH